MAGEAGSVCEGIANARFLGTGKAGLGEPGVCKERCRCARIDFRNVGTGRLPFVRTFVCKNGQ